MLVVSLTSIPPRFPSLPKVIAALWQQDVRPDRILLTIPKSYRRFPGTFALPDLPGVEVLRTQTDLGPASKVLPAAKALQGQKCQLLYCDDDWIYAPDWSAGFLRAAKAQPKKTVICASGYNVGRLGVKSSAQQGCVDIAQGFGGVLIQPEWLPPAAFTPPECAWAVDDIWLSGMFAKQEIPVWNEASLRGLASPIADPGNLQGANIAGQDRANANRETVSHLSKAYGIWGGVNER